MEPEHTPGTPWLVELLRLMSDTSTSRDDVRLFFDRRAVGSARVSELPHVQIDIRVEIDLDSPSTLDALQQELGPARPLPRRPDDFHSGSHYAFSDVAPSSRYWIRVLAELDRSDAARVTRLSVDRSIRAE